MNNLSQFTNVYQLQKTLRFELIPVGETQKHIEENGILENDQRRAENYKLMKKTIDEYHKAFIDRALTGVKLTGLEEFCRLYTQSDSKDEKWKASFRKCKDGLRKEIVKYFTLQGDYSDLNKKELIQNRLKAWIDSAAPDLYYSDEFRSFTTYFTGYNTNRLNMYSDEEKSTAIAYRLINENLPKFIDNINTYEKIKKTSVSENFARLCKDMEPWLNVASLDELFSLENYTNILTQAQIEAYNVIIGGRKTENEKLQGLNEYINLYNQKNPDSKLPKMKILYKQILSERVSLSWLPETFSDAAEVFGTVRDFSFILSEQYEKLKKVICLMSEANAENIYCRSDAVTGISNILFGDYSVLLCALEASESTGKKKRNAKKDDEPKKPDYYSLAHIQTRLNEYMSRCDDKPDGFSEDCITRYFVERLPELSVNIDDVLTMDHDSSYTMTQSDKDSLKAYLDSAMDILHFVKPLYVSPDSELKRDDLFYGEFAPIYEELSDMILLYDKVRNFATKKPYSTEKIKLNFDCSTLFDGWDLNKETQNLGVLLIRGGKYYLGIMDKKHNRIFENIDPSSDTGSYSKIEYKLLPGPNKMLPKVFFSKSRIDEFAPDEEILRIYKEGTFKKGDNFRLSDCHKLIDFFKSSINRHPEWSKFDFAFSPTEKYSDISGFYREISEQGYKLTYKPVSSVYIDELVREGKLYLFQIYNKDFSPYSKGKPNLHTMYWQALFSEDNLRNVVYKLNGQAEMFYRKRSIDIEKAVVHPAGQELKKKNPVLDGQFSKFDYPITKDRRYTCDKFQFHVPMTMNFKAQSSDRMNEEVFNYLKNNPDVNIIGIDRGERNLLYISLIDRNGKVVKDKDGRDIQYSLNTMKGEYRDSSGNKVNFETPYQELLAEKEKNRDEQRKNWGEIENIKELKAGYLSQVVHHIAKLMVEHNAIVVMEDLNFGFKRGRFKVERQVYQNFEKALIEKLNYLVFKDYAPDKTGGLYHALQLTEKFTSFKDMRCQCGFIFYVPAWDTSKIDPTTGFVDLLKPKYTNVADAQRFFAKFKHIFYNSDVDGFVFGIDYSDFTQKAEGSRTQWDICTQGETRYTYNRSLNNNKGGTEKINVTEGLKSLFTKYGIAFASGENIKCAVADRTEAEFFRSLIKYLQITLAMRYSSAEDGEDFILSPVAGTDGSFYCSKTRKAGQPQDADANGAYNIAKKGLMLLEQLDKAEKYNDWKITNKDWLTFAQEHIC